MSTGLMNRIVKFADQTLKFLLDQEFGFVRSFHFGAKYTCFDCITGFFVVEI